MSSTIDTRRQSTKIPSYRLHKPSGRGVVTLNGRDIWLGKHGTPDSRERYDRAVNEWLANGRRPVRTTTTEDMTIVELVTSFWPHVEETYRRADGTATNEVHNFQRALKPLRMLYSSLPVRQFRPRQLKAVRQKMIELGWCRTRINKQIGRIKLMMRWAVENEHVATIVTSDEGKPRSFLEPLLAVKGLRKGQTDAKESDPVKPVPQAMIDTTLRPCGRHLAAMIQVQLYTGMRPGELLVMRTGDIDRDSEIWTYRPRQHKGEHRGHGREIWIGPKAQAILIPFLKLDPDAFIFSPADAEADRRQRQHEARIADGTPLVFGNKPGTNKVKRPLRTPGKRFTVPSYGRAIAYACVKAFPLPTHLARHRVAGAGRKSASTRWETAQEWRKRLGEDGWQAKEQFRREHSWHPHQLRHAAATELRREFGLEAARIILGHRSSAITETYAERDTSAAKDIMKRVG